MESELGEIWKYNLKIKYGGRRFYQYNKDDFLKSFFWITRLQVIKEKFLFNWQLIFDSMFLSIHAV